MDNRDHENGVDRKDEIYSKSVRAGKRTYFFDVKSTKGEDYYLTINYYPNSKNEPTEINKLVHLFQSIKFN